MAVPFGWKHSEEHKEYMRRIMKGRPSHRKGKILSEETRRKMSVARTGYHPPPEVIEKMRQPKSAEHRKSLSIAKMGKPCPWRRGQKLSAEHKAKLLAAVKGRPAWNRGKHTKDYSLRQLIRMSETYRHWRLSILKRDGFRCVICNASGYHAKLQVDHYPVSFAQIVKDNRIKSIEESLLCKALWDIKNNRTLCLSCHKKTPNYFNRNSCEKYVNR